MSDNNKSGNNKGPKGEGPNRPDDNFDWSKVIRLVFGWGAVIVAAVIVMQVFRTGTENYTEIPFKEYENILNQPENIKSVKIVKSDLNDYSFKAELKNQVTETALRISRKIGYQGDLP